MNRQASILFNIIPSSSSGNYSALQGTTVQHSYYQRLIYSLLSRSSYTTEGFQPLCNQLAEIARHADFARQMDAVEQASQIMLALPTSGHLRSIAQHYQALCAKRKGDFDTARRLLERVAEGAMPQYRARALQVIGATYYEQGKVDLALPFYVAAGKAALGCDLLTVAESQRMIAIVRSIHGDHKQALKDIENLFPLVRVIAKRYPLPYYHFLNSLAVELGEVGRINEAQAVCEITVASPFASAYPEWIETCDEIDAKRTSATPSIVAVCVAPEPKPSPQPSRNRKPALARPLIRSAREKVFFQISIAITTLVIAHSKITRSILDRVRHSINPRGPPSHLQI